MILWRRAAGDNSWGNLDAEQLCQTGMCSLTEEGEENMALLPLSTEQVKGWNSGLGGCAKDLTKGT